MSQQAIDHHPQPQALANGVRINPATAATAAAAFRLRVNDHGWAYTTSGSLQVSLVAHPIGTRAE